MSTEAAPPASPHLAPSRKWPESASTMLLKSLLKANQDWELQLRSAITAAYAEAKEKKIKDSLLPLVPSTLEEFFVLIDRLCAWIPTLYNDKHEPVAKNIYYQLCSMYFVLDHAGGKELQKSPIFNDWMRFQAKEWGKFCNSSASITAESLESFIALAGPTGMRMNHYMETPGGYMSFNQLFARETKPGYRPIDCRRDDSVLCSPADFTYRAHYSIGPDGTVIVPVPPSAEAAEGTPTCAIVKNAEIGNISQLLGPCASQYAEHFHGGLFYHGFLGPGDYHRFRVPARGVVLESEKIEGRVYLQVKLSPSHDEPGRTTFDAPDDSFAPLGETGYEFRQDRGVLIMDTPTGLLAICPIGMCQVSSVNMTAEKGVYLDKGDEFGYFMFGGSDMILLFSPKSNYRPDPAFLDLETNLGQHVFAGQTMGTVTVVKEDPTVGHEPNPDLPRGFGKR